MVTGETKAFDLQWSRFAAISMTAEGFVFALYTPALMLSFWNLEVRAAMSIVSAITFCLLSFAIIVGTFKPTNLLERDADSRRLTRARWIGLIAGLFVGIGCQLSWSLPLVGRPGLEMYARFAIVALTYAVGMQGRAIANHMQVECPLCKSISRLSLGAVLCQLVTFLAWVAGGVLGLTFTELDLTIAPGASTSSVFQAWIICGTPMVCVFVQAVLGVLLGWALIRLGLRLLRSNSLPSSLMQVAHNSSDEE